MIPDSGLGQEVLDALAALGLLSPDGTLDPAWFEAPLARVRALLSNPAQRDALFRLIAALRPEETPADAPEGEHWYPLSSGARSGVFLTARLESSTALRVGVAARVLSESEPLATLLVRLPVVRVEGTEVSALAGTADGPLRLDLALQLGFARPAQPIGLEALRLSAEVALLGGQELGFTGVLHGLDLGDGRPPRDFALDEALGAETGPVLLGLLRRAFESLGTGASAPAHAVRDHLLPILGLVDGIPPLPLHDAASDAAAWRRWFASVADEAGAVWLGHVAALLGGAGGLASGNGSVTDPFRARVLAFGGQSGLSLTLALEDGGAAPRLLFGTAVELVAAGSAASVLARATLVALPLAGALSPTALPELEVTIEAPAAAGLLIDTPEVRVAKLRAGLGKRAAELVPVLELRGVTLAGTSYERIDLSNVDAAVAAASGLVRDALLSALGASPAAGRLLSLVGLGAPSLDPAWPHAVDLSALVANPARGIAGYYRQVLADPVHGFGVLFGELCLLLGFNGPVTGAGTRGDPWRSELATSGVLALSVAAFAGYDGPSDTHELHLGLLSRAASDPGELSWLAEAVGFRLGPSGAAPSGVRLFGSQRVAARLTQVPEAADALGVALSADSVGLELAWERGGALTGRALLSGLTLTAGETSLAFSELAYPPPAPFDVANPGAALGVTTADFDALLRLLGSRAALAWGGFPGWIAAALLGLHGGLPELPPDWPLLAAAPGEASWLQDPARALRDVVRRVLVESSGDGRAFRSIALEWLRAWLGRTLPASLDEAPALSALHGSGHYDDPFRLSLGAGEVAALAWFEPAGPPVPRSALAARITAATGYRTLLDAAAVLAPFVPALRTSLAGLSLEPLAVGLRLLGTHLEDGDGLVESRAELASGPSWQQGVPVVAAHPNLPRHAGAIVQILDRIDALAPGARAVLLLGPSYGDDDAWADLQTAASTRGHAVLPGTAFGEDAGAVTASADYYTARLPEVSADERLQALVARVRELRPGAPLIVVAHSIAGLTARARVAASPAGFAGLITLGTPHGGALLAPLRDARLADAVRFLEHGSVLPAGPVDDAVRFLARALDGFSSSSPSLPAELAPFPLASFAGSTTTDTGGVPALALSGALQGSFLEALRAALQGVLVALPEPTFPTHLALGLRVELPLPSPPSSAVTAELAFRLGGAALALDPTAPVPPRAARTATVDCRLLPKEQADGQWLVGSAGARPNGEAPPEARLRWAELGFDLLANQPRVRLHHAAFRGRGQAELELDGPSAGPVLDALIRRLDLPALLEALEALELVVRDARGAAGLSADAIAALRVDGVSFLRPRLAAALARPEGLCGLRPANGAFRAERGGFELVVAPDPWTVSLRATAFPLGAPAALDLDASLTLFSRVASVRSALQVGALRVAFSEGRVVAEAAPWLDPTVLVPVPAPPERAALLARLVPQLVVSSALGAVLESVLGPAFSTLPIHRLLDAPGSGLARPEALGGSSGFDGGKIARLLGLISEAFGESGEQGLVLPAGLRLTASGSGPMRVVLSTTAPLGGTLSFELHIEVDGALHATPGGSLSFALDLGAAPWSRLVVTFAAGAGGVSLSIAPAGSAPIRLLPTFGGLGALGGGAAALLPHALDELTSALPPGPLLSLALDVAARLDLYDPAGGFAAHEATFRDVATPGFPGRVALAARAPFAAAVGALFTTPGSPLAAIPGTVAVAGEVVTWTAPSLPVFVALGFRDHAPLVRVGVVGLSLPGSPVAVDLAAEHSAGAFSLAARAALDLSGVGVSARPELSLSGSVSTFALALRPLGNELVVVELAPALGVRADLSSLRDFARAWFLPLASQVLLEASGSRLDAPLWGGGPTPRDLLRSAGIVDAAGVLTLPLPSLHRVVAGLVKGMASGDPPAIALGSSLGLRPVLGSGRLAFQLQGALLAEIGGLEGTVLFGAPESWMPEPRPGVTLGLFDVAGDDSLTFRPSLRLAGVGLRIGKPGGAQLVSTSAFRLGAAAAYAFVDLPLHSGTPSEPFGAALELVECSLPFGQATQAGGNPVASSMLGSGEGGGNAQQAGPAVDVIAIHRDGSTRVLFEGTAGPVWIDVERSFGPVAVKGIGIVPTPDPGVEILVDGSVAIAGLKVQVDDLGVVIPFASVLSPSAWRLGLRGLAIAYTGPGVSVAGGLSRFDGPPVEYRGVLEAKLADRTIAGMGAFARPRDAAGEFASFFGFVAVSATLGGPPFCFVTGLAGGLGYNRRLLLPELVEDVPLHPLVRAMDDGALIADPMGALESVGHAVPAKRGAFWLAAGIRFTSFGLVQTRALLSVAVDREIEVGLLGLSRMVLPAADRALVNVELAIRARYSTAEQLLSAQGQLTDRSWLLHRDCRLTGGFAFAIWFDDGQAVLTLGGYHPAFQKPARFPDVPRLGFRWQATERAVIKGEAYFALTTSCVMAGGLLSIDYRKGGVHAWFEAKAAFLISWDPFHYDIEVGVTVGASVRIEVCFIKCWHKTLSFSLGADLHLIGPPLHGEVSLGLGPVSVTVSFGDSSSRPSYLPSFAAFRDKHLLAGDPGGSAVDVYLKRGGVAGAPAAAGTSAAPFRVESEFELRVESRMAGTHVRHPGALDAVAVPGADALDVAPMGDVPITRSELALRLQSRDPTGWVDFAGPSGLLIEPVLGRVPEALYRYQEPEHVAAAANTLGAVVALSVRAEGTPGGQSAVIPIGTLVDDVPELTRPLPFARRSAASVAAFQEAGRLAEVLVGPLAGAPTAKRFDVADSILAGAGVFAAGRSALGLPPGGLGPNARRTLRRRSAPPLIAPLSSGLTMQPVGVPAPPRRAPALTAAPVALTAPRLRALLRQPARAEAQRPPSLGTSVNVPAGVKRMPVPGASAASGAALRTTSITGGVPVTALPALGTTLRSVETFGATGRAHAKAMAEIEAQLVKQGTTVAAGVAQVWDLVLPEPSTHQVLVVKGEGATRVVAMRRGGAVLFDQELSSGGHELALPSGTERCVVWGLGRTPREIPFTPGFGAVSARVAANGLTPAVGWQLGGRVLLVGQNILLARGATLFTDRTLAGAGMARAGEGVIGIDAALAGSSAVETWLPTSTEVVVIALDVLDCGAAERGDLTIAVAGGSLSTTPSRITGPRRRLLFYDVAARRDAAHLDVSVASHAGYRLSGVIGLAGRAAEHAARLQKAASGGALPEGFVPDGPFSAGGGTRIALEQREGAR